jgi:putative transposase
LYTLLRAFFKNIRSLQMLSDSEFKQWCQALGLTGAARGEVERIRSSPPARRVRSGPYNVKGHFNQSRKMDHTIQFESRTVELPAILTMEYFDDDVLEIWDQPPSFNILYKGANGKNLGHVYTADFFVIRKRSAGWEEWKPEKDLAGLAEKNRERYYKDEGGGWRCPPCERYAARFPPLYFRVRSSLDINWVLIRNLKLLRPFFEIRKGGG